MFNKTAKLTQKKLDTIIDVFGCTIDQLDRIEEDLQQIKETQARDISVQIKQIRCNLKSVGSSHLPSTKGDYALIMQEIKAIKQDLKKIQSQIYHL